ncbi:MAG: membrane protein insertase YidC [Proteobacteria bacterium]|nr:membrane protein insertase YidC [Pseudomonadota bacterium]
MGDNSDNKNLILAAVLSMAVVVGWQFLFLPAPPPPADPATVEGQPDTVPAATVEGGAGVVAPGLQTDQTRGEALAAAPRVPIETEALTGSIALTGGRLDDLHLSLYRETLEPDAATVVLLNPAGGPAPYFIDYGWRRTVDSDPGPLPGTATPWTLERGKILTPATPIVLRWDNGEGLTFRRMFEIDERYMFTIIQSVENTTGGTVTLAPYGAIARRGEPDGVGFYILHEGAVGVFDGELTERDYDDIRDFEASSSERGPVEITSVTENGWLGFTDKYWLTTLTPLPGQTFEAVFRMLNLSGTEEFRAEMRLPVISIAAGATAESVTQLFAGAKEFYTLTGYEEDFGIVDFHKAIDWGWFYFLTKPIFQLLAWIYGLLGNMGFSIIVMTLLVKACLFPLAYKSFVSMSRMKKLQPEMEKIKERVGDDKKMMQQEMMALYKKEKVNPAAGCLPIVLQIPIFFSLYKVLFVTIEMRQAPFVGWIHDLAAPDPTSFLNLFGLIPYQIPAFLAIVSIGVFPILMGVTMWMQQKLNPAPTDPTQKMIFAWMPWVFMFMLGRFASGLVIYWCANNIITFTQQYIIMRSQGIEIDLMGNIKSGFKRKPVVAASTPPPAKADETETDAADPEPGKETPRRKKPAPKSGGKSGTKSGTRSRTKPGGKSATKPAGKSATKPAGKSRRKRSSGGG